MHNIVSDKLYKLFLSTVRMLHYFKGKLTNKQI